MRTDLPPAHGHNARRRNKQQVVGFAPRSAAILAGILPNPPLSVHVHAALMSLWLVLLLVQGSLIAGRNRRLHATLGLGSLVLVPLIVTSMVLAALGTYGLMQAAGAGMLGSSILLLVPLLAYDWLRFGRVHQAWVAGLALYLPFVLLSCALWLSPAWHAFASNLLGY